MSDHNIVKKDPGCSHEKPPSSPENFTLYLVCSKIFHIKQIDTHMDTQMLGHNKDTVEKFNCDVCQIRLSSKHALKNHKKQHSGELICPYQYCNIRFKTVAIISRHLMAVQPNKAAEIS